MAAENRLATSKAHTGQKDNEWHDKFKSEVKRPKVVLWKIFEDIKENR